MEQKPLLAHFVTVATHLQEQERASTRVRSAREPCTLLRGEVTQAKSRVSPHRPTMRVLQFDPAV